MIPDPFGNVAFGNVDGVLSNATRGDTIHQLSVAAIHQIVVSERFSLSYSKLAEQ